MPVTFARTTDRPRLFDDRPSSRARRPARPGRDQASPNRESAPRQEPAPELDFTTPELDLTPPAPDVAPPPPDAASPPSEPHALREPEPAAAPERAATREPDALRGPAASPGPESAPLAPPEPDFTTREREPHDAARSPRPGDPTDADAARHALTLDHLISTVWDELTAHRTVSCPVCHGHMVPRYGSAELPVGGRCRRCGSSLG